MLRHVALFRLKPDVPADTPQRLSEALAKLPAAIPQLVAYAHGADLGLREGNYDFGVVADLANAQDFDTYVAHPAHQAFLKDVLTPVLAERVSIQIEL